MMETKQAHSYLSNNAKLNNCEKFRAPSKLINLCKIRAKSPHSHQQKQGIQQQQQHQRYQQLNTLCLNAKDLQQFPRYLNKSTMFSYPRRRKSLHEKRLRQGQKNSLKNCKNMLHASTDIMSIHRDDDHINAMKFNSFLLKSSGIATKMWHNE